MIEDIRKKHERRYNVDDINESSYCDHLRMREVDELFKALDAERGKVEKAHKAIDYAFHYIQQLPSGCDEEADEEDTSPCDMTAHIGGLILRRLEKALDELEADKILTGEGK